MFNVSRLSVNYSLSLVAMHALSHDTSRLFLPHSNTLEALKYFVTLYATSIFASFCFLFAHSDSSYFVDCNSFSFAKKFRDKVSLTILRFDLFSFVEQLCDNFLFTILRFDSPSFITLTFKYGAVISV